MAHWKYLTDQEKEMHELYKKRTALDLFYIYLVLQLLFSLYTIPNTFAEYNMYMEVNYSQVSDLSKFIFYIISSIPPLLLFIFLTFMSKYGKSKTTVKLLIALLTLLPIVTSICIIMRAQLFDLDIDFAISSAFGITFVYIFFGIVFALYSFSSKTFKLQYLNKVWV